jgi:hypothetical protein
VDLVKQDRVDVFALEDVELGGEIVDRVGDQLLLRAPTPVDRVLPDARARGNCFHRCGLKAAFGQKLERRFNDRRARVGAARPTTGAPCAVCLSVLCLDRSHLSELSSSGIRGDTDTFSLVKNE